MRRRVVLTGWGQVTQRKEHTDILDPLGLMSEATRLAADPIGGSDVLSKLSGIMVVRPLSEYYVSAAEQLAEIIGATPRFTLVSRIGGNSPQSLINKAAGMIARGELESVLITGAEAFYPRNADKKTTKSVLFKGIPEDYQSDDAIGATEAEMRHGVVLPIHGFPLYETALWAASGLNLKDYLLQIGMLWSDFSKIAAAHPNSWTKMPRNAAEIITPTPSNRMIAFPYTKFMNPLITADLGAAVILMSEKKAQQHLEKGRRPVYFLGGGYAQDRQRFMIQKSDFISSPPLKAAVQKSLNRSHLTLDEIQCFDVYSCFPCAVSVARRMLELKDNDPRPLTLTGGLGFFGGPGNNYSLHAVATLADAIACEKIDNGLITSLGWFMHKHAAGVYGATPVDTDLQYHDLEDEKDYLVGKEPVKIIDNASGKGVIETYTVVYLKDATSSYAVIYGKTDKGLRFIAQPHPDSDVFNILTTQNQVGASVQLRHDAGRNQNIAELP